MSEITRNDYWKEVRSLAEDIAEAARDGDFGADEDSRREGMEERLWETIDGHQWVIYTAYNYDVLRHSDNDGYTIEQFGTDGLVEDDQLRTDRLASGALYADVSEILWDLDWKPQDDDDSDTA